VPVVHIFYRSRRDRPPEILPDEAATSTSAKRCRRDLSEIDRVYAPVSCLLDASGALH
jgi:hypothetical protein